MQAHRFDPVSAFFGVLFVAAALNQLLDIDVDRLLPWRVFWAVVIIGSGVVLLLSALRREESDR
jgi:hypothetical protein